MALVVQTRTSLRDINRIWDYIAETSPQRASKFVRRIKEKLALLAENPMMGRARPELADDLRSFPVEKYVIFYRPVEEGIIVVRVVHSRQEIEGMFD